MTSLVNTGVTKTAESAPSSDRGTVADLVLDVVSNLREYRGSVETAELTNHERDSLSSGCHYHASGVKDVLVSN